MGTGWWVFKRCFRGVRAYGFAETGNFKTYLPVLNKGHTWMCTPVCNCFVTVGIARWCNPSRETNNVGEPLHCAALQGITMYHQYWGENLQSIRSCTHDILQLPSGHLFHMKLIYLWKIVIFQFANLLVYQRVIMLSDLASVASPDTRAHLADLSWLCPLIALFAPLDYRGHDALEAEALEFISPHHPLQEGSSPFSALLVTRFIQILAVCHHWAIIDFGCNLLILNPTVLYPVSGLNASKNHS